MVDREHGEVSFTRKPDVVITFRASREFKEWLQREAFQMDKSASDFIRASIVAGHPLVKALRGLDRLDIEDIKDLDSGKHT